MKQSQPPQFKRTNIKVIKTEGTVKSQNSAQITQIKDKGPSTDNSLLRVINFSFLQEKLNEQERIGSMGPPKERTQIQNVPIALKSMSQEPQVDRTSTNLKQINSQDGINGTDAPEEISGLVSIPSTKKHKLYLPKKTQVPSQGPGGVQLQDGHRRRLQALAAAQNESQNIGRISTESKEESAFTSNINQGRDKSNTTNSTLSSGGHIKVIQKKLIILNTKKVQGRNVVATSSNTTDIVFNDKNAVYHSNADQKANSAQRPTTLNNVNFDPIGNLGFQPQVVQTSTHQSALSRFNVNPNSNKQGGSSVMHTHRQTTQMKKTNSGPSSVVEHQLTKSDGLRQSYDGGISKKNQMVDTINIRQEASPNRTAFKPQPASGRKYHQVHQGLGYRRHQIIQDITDETSPQAVGNFSATGYPRQMVNQSSESSMKSLKQIAKTLNKQTDLKKVFYANNSQSPSTKSINTLQSNQSSGGPPSSQPSQQFTLTKKANLISQEVSASASRERTLNFKLKKHGQHGQLQNHKEKLKNHQKQLINPLQIGQATNLIPQVGKRQPLIIRKNNFVLTKSSNAESSNDVLSLSNPPGSTLHAGGVARVRIQPLNVGINKLDVTLNSNNSGNRALNNTQKIGRQGATDHGVNSNESVGSEASLSQHHQQLAQKISSVNASLKKQENGPAVFSNFYNNNGSPSQRKTSEASFEKLPGGQISQSQQPPGSRLIKVNRSKKKLDTARRSRIQQLKDINFLDSGPHQQPLVEQFASTIKSQSREIPQMNKNHSNDLQTKLKASNILQVQTDFQQTLPIKIHKPAGSITIKGDSRQKGSQNGSVELLQDASLAKNGNSTGKLNIQNFNQHNARAVRNSQNNGLRPVRLFNYATTTETQSAGREISDVSAINIQQSFQREKEESDKQITAPSKGMPTPSSARSQKSLRRGQIFRKQTRRNSQVNEESSMAGSKENTKSLPHNVMTHITTPTDAQNISNAHLPLKQKRSNQFSTNRQPESDKNQQSSYYASSSGDKIGGGSKPESNQTGSGLNQKPLLNRQKQKMKQFDSEGQLQKSANELTKMKNENSELIVPTSNLIGYQQSSAKEILKHDNRARFEKTASEADLCINGIIQVAPLLEVEPSDGGQETSRDNNDQREKKRSLERVESSKNLRSLNCEKIENVFQKSQRDQKSKEDIFDKSPLLNQGPAADVVFDTDQIVVDKQHLLLAPLDSSRISHENAQAKSHAAKFVSITDNHDNEVIYSDSDNQKEPNIPVIVSEEPKKTTNNQQDELRIQHNETIDTLHPPGPSVTSGNLNGKFNKLISGQIVKNKFSVTKGSDLTRELMTQTDDTSNRKTVSNQRAYCNSSDSRVHVAATAFSFKSQTSPEFQEVPQFPMKAQQALIYFQNQLTEYEKKEILNYPEIYFIGAPSAQKIHGSVQGEHNYGYDDEKGDYKIVTNDHLGFRYEIKSFLGKGSFGTALKCFDHKDGVEVAVKVIKNKKKYYYQAGVELKILQFLKENDPEDIMNVIHLNDYVIFRKHLCIGFELMSMNLFEFLKINDFNGFDHNLIRRFAIQLLYALKYLKMFQIIHCDLKPENILLKESNKSGIKIIDFGSSTFLDERVYTYIQSRFYRAPEIMLGIPYDCGIDMWSFGCIMAELYIGYPIFPGDSENDQMSRLIEMLDVPDSTVLAMSSRKDKFFTKSADGLSIEPIMCKNSRGKLRKPMGKPLALVIGDEDPEFTEFVQKCLEWNPNERMTPDEALKHVWILKGLPPQVLIHHQKMHNIETPELPLQVLAIRNQFIEEQIQSSRAHEMQQVQKLQKQQSQQRLQEQTSPKAAAAPINMASGSKERSSRIRLKLVPATNGRNANNYNTTATQPRQVIPPAQVILSLQRIPTNDQVYPGSTKSANKSNLLGKNGKLTFKIQQNSNGGRPKLSGAKKQTQVVQRAQHGVVNQQTTADAHQQQNQDGTRKQADNIQKTTAVHYGRK